MSSIPTLNTGTPIVNPDSCVLNVDNDVGLISSPGISKKDFSVVVEKDNNDTSPTISKWSSGTNLVTLTKVQVKKHSEMHKYFCWIYIFSLYTTNFFLPYSKKCYKLWKEHKTAEEFANYTLDKFDLSFKFSQQGKN